MDFEFELTRMATTLSVQRDENLVIMTLDDHLDDTGRFPRIQIVHNSSDELLPVAVIGNFVRIKEDIYISFGRPEVAAQAARTIKSLDEGIYQENALRESMPLIARVVVDGLGGALAPVEKAFKELWSELPDNYAVEFFELPDVPDYVYYVIAYDKERTRVVYSDDAMSYLVIEDGFGYTASEWHPPRYVSNYGFTRQDGLVPKGVAIAMLDGPDNRLGRVIT